MLKPEMLQRGDKIAIVSLSWGGLGDEKLIHKYYIAKERLENDLIAGIMNFEIYVLNIKDWVKYENIVNVNLSNNFISLYSPFTFHTLS